MQTTLVIMAAGIGSRFGTGIKQLATMNSHADGSQGEIIMDYSIYDAVEAGFNQVVFIIRHAIADEFKEVIGNRMEKALEKYNVTVDYAYQELEDIPAPFEVPEGRTKPWGTGQAVLTCKDIVKNPFIIINADDYYGKEAFVKLHDFLVTAEKKKDKMSMAMAGFILKNTVSENGTVTRGVCVADDNSMLTSVIETHEISIKDGVVSCEETEVQKWITPDSTASMNMWAAFPEFFDVLESKFVEFLGDNEGNPLKKEYLVPIIVDQLLKAGKAEVKVLETQDKWIGITYHEDLESARDNFQRMIKNGKYKENLWN